MRIKQATNCISKPYTSLYNNKYLLKIFFVYQLQSNPAHLFACKHDEILFARTMSFVS